MLRLCTCRQTTSTLLVLGALFFLSCLSPEDRLEPWRLPVAGSPSALLPPDILAIEAEPGGEALWFGTAGGASRLDLESRTWQSYGPLDGLAHSYVLAIEAEPGGKAIWFGTLRGGASRYELESRTWQIYDARDGLADDHVQAIQAEPGGKALWFGTARGGANRFELESRTWQTYRKQDGLADNDVQTIQVGPGGKALWFGTAQGGVSRYDLVSHDWQTFSEQDGLADNYVRAIQVEPGGKALWFGTLRRGASRFDLGKRTWQTYGPRDGLAHNYLRAIQIEPGGKALWFGTAGGGASRYDLARRTWQSFSKEDGLADYFVRAIQIEPGDKALWFATVRGGANRYDLEKRTWQTYDTVGGLADDSVHALQTEPGGKALWFGTAGGGASRFDLEKRTWQTFGIKDGLIDTHIQAMQVEPGGEALWFGTLRGGASRYDLEKRTWQTFGPHNGLAHHDVFTIQAEPGGEALWFGIRGGVSRFDLESRTWQTYDTIESLAGNPVTAIQAEPGRNALWFATYGGGASRYDLDSRTWQTFDVEDGLAHSLVLAIQAEPGGKALWLGTQLGVSRFDLESRTWQTFSTEDGLAHNFIQAIQTEPGGNALWFGNGGGASRFDLNSRMWQTFGTQDEFANNPVRAIEAEPGGEALWFSTTPFLSSEPATRLASNLWAPTELGSAIAIKAWFRWESSDLVVADGVVFQTRPLGLTVTDSQDAESSFLDVAHRPLDITPGPSGLTWIAYRLGGLGLRGRYQDLRIYEGLPSSDVQVLSAVPDSGGTVVWAGTSGGAAQVRASDGGLHLERTVTFEDGLQTESGLPTGPVDALAAAADGSVFLAYNSIDAKFFFGRSDLAKRRTRAQVRYVPAEGDPEERQILLPIEAKIRDLALSPPRKLLGLFPHHEETLWAATSAGLFKARNPRRPGVAFERVTASGLGVPLHTVKVDAQSNVWTISEAQRDALPAVIGYRPGVATTRILTEADGSPIVRPGNDLPRIDDLDFTDTGELVVLAQNDLAKGRIRLSRPSVLPVVGLALVLGIWVAIFRHPMVVRLRAKPETLRQLPFPQILVALRRLRRARALDEVCATVGLGPKRRKQLLTLADFDQTDLTRLHALAELLGADVVREAGEILRPGLDLLWAKLPGPPPLRQAPTPLLAFDPDANPDADPAELRAVLASFLAATGHRAELPLLLLCRDRAQARALIPQDHGALLLSEKELRTLLFARSPQQTFAGLLLSHDLLALSPYHTRGEVKDANMFYGRGRLLREMLTGPQPHAVVVGPRRIGKTSLLVRLCADLPSRHSDLEIVKMDFLRVANLEAAVRKLVRALGLPRSAALEIADGSNVEHLAELLAERFNDQPGLLVIDEADDLARVDEAAGYPLLSTLRSAHAEGHCSVVLAGYWHLYRRTLEHDTPLFNLAPQRRLGPLETEAARALATEPMERLGLAWADPKLPVTLIERAGAYPDLVQMLCGAVLGELRNHKTLTLTEAHLAAAEASPDVRDRVLRTFRANMVKAGQIMVDRLLEHDTFTGADAHAALEDTTGRNVPLAVRDRLLLQLVLYGFAVEKDGTYRWTIPLVRETLLSDIDREERLRRLVAELEDDTSSWTA